MWLKVLIVDLIFIKSILTVEFKRYVIEDTNDPAERLNVQKVLDLITRSKEQRQNYRRRLERAEKIQFLYDLLTSSVGPAELKKWINNQGQSEPAPKIQRTQDIEGLIESELKNALSLKSSALLDRPIVQKRGKNDFLVIKPRVVDPFVTVVPNNIYYDIEKKCANWLDDCNAEGIRSRLLQRVKSPFK